MRSVVFALACALVLVAVGGSPSEARGHKKNTKIARVTKINRMAQDWYHGKLKVSWKGVKGSSYQWRYASSPSGLSGARLLWSGTSRGTYTGTLNRGATWYFQARALRRGVPGPWSAIRQLRFVNYWPNTPSISGTRLTDAVQFNWNYAANASRYRVRWSPAWYGAWPGAATYTPWVSQYARSSVLKLPTNPGPGDGMIAVPYANPVFGQVQANNQYVTNGSGTHISRWIPVWAKAPAPKAGDAVRFGTYNVMLNPSTTRAVAAARNIASHGLTMVALQEANENTAQAMVRNLGSAWAYVPTTSTSQQILYRKDLFTMRSQGTFEVDNPRAPSTPVVTPYARFSAKNPVSQNSQSFYVTSVHFTENAGKSAMDKNADTGKAAKEAIDEMSRIDYAGEPIIAAGDMRYGREPWGDVAGYVPAQPTFIRNGYYDAMASQAMYGYTYSTYNSNSAHQAPNAAGLGPRSDYIVMKGIVGSKMYQNVANWSYNGVVPSDHNLVYSDILVPTR